MSPGNAGPEARPGVVLLNFGGPRDLEEVRPFLYEILKDPNTLQIPLPRAAQNLLARRIARRRAPEIRRQYGEIGGRSPIVPATERVATALRAALRLGEDTPAVFVAHRYLPGWAAETAREIVAAEVTTLLAVPLYPHFCYATTGSSLEQLHRELGRAGYLGGLQAVRSYPDAPPYLEALGERLEACLREGGLRPGETVVLCSAHGLPAAYVEPGDPYRLELYRTVDGLRARFPEWEFRLSYQSRLGPVEWLRPYTDEVVPLLAEEGARHVVFLPISFLNDHIETWYEIGHTYFGLARSAGLTPHLVAAVEDHPAFVALLREFVIAWRAGRGALPVEELLPPDQWPRRYGWWLWLAWIVALFASLLNALA